MPRPRVPSPPGLAPVRAAALALLIAATSVSSARAQVVMGLVVDSASRRPLPAVAVHLFRLSADGVRDSAVARAFTHRDGAFTLAAPAPGRYQVLIGDGLAGPPLALASADSVDQHLYPITRSLAGALFEFQVEKQAASVPGSVNLRYPSILQSQNVEGKVVAQFVVDTTGQAEMGTWTLLESTHPLFAWASYDAVRDARFRPAEAGGRKVRQLVQLPLAFSLDRNPRPGARPAPSRPASALDRWLESLPQVVPPATGRP
jgi:hypothetical protein